MRGCRPLSPIEIHAISSNMDLRDRALFVLGIRTGFRVSELLSLDVIDVIQDGRIRDAVCVKKRNTKGKKAGRTVPLHTDAVLILREYLDCAGLQPSSPLFPSNRGNRLDRVTVHRNLKQAFKRAGIENGIGIIATHSMRKTFAANIYEAVGKNILDLQHAMGHKQLSSTASYIQVDMDRINKVIKNLK